MILRTLFFKLTLEFKHYLCYPLATNNLVETSNLFFKNRILIACLCNETMELIKSEIDRFGESGSYLVSSYVVALKLRLWKVHSPTKRLHPCKRGLTNSGAFCWDVVTIRGDAKQKSRRRRSQSLAISSSSLLSLRYRPLYFLALMNRVTTWALLYTPPARKGRRNNQDRRKSSSTDQQRRRRGTEIRIESKPGLFRWKNTNSGWFICPLRDVRLTTNKKKLILFSFLFFVLRKVQKVSTIRC